MHLESVIDWIENFSKKERSEVNEVVYIILFSYMWSDQDFRKAAEWEDGPKHNLSTA